MSGDIVRIIIGTFGVSEWAVQAKFAMMSALEQSVPCDVVHVHGRGLAEARNMGAAAAGADWFVFLDADDTLDRHYVEAMLDGEGDLRQPSTLGVYPDGREDAYPVLIPKKPLIDGNYLVCGTMIRRHIFELTGGFDPILPYAEDWDLMIKARLAGAVVGHCPDAIYRVGVNENSRNNQPREIVLHWYNQIRNRYVEQARQLEAQGVIL